MKHTSTQLCVCVCVDIPPTVLTDLPQQAANPPQICWRRPDGAGPAEAAASGGGKEAHDVCVCGGGVGSPTDVTRLRLRAELQGWM